jgi:hypothetical protein
MQEMTVLCMCEICYHLLVYKIIIVPVVQYDYATWSRILGEEPRLRVFENRVLRKSTGTEEG